ncbi:MAG: flagellar motor protein MotB [Salinivenus sp.]
MIRLRLSHILSIGLGLWIFALGGCGTSQPASRSAQAPDSLRAANAQLRDDNATLRDSLQFYDDLESGQYDRDRRVLQDQVNRLVYDVQLFEEGGQTVSTVPVDSLFATAADSLSPDGQRRLEAIAAQLQQTYPDRTVRVEGHADSASLSGDLQDRYPSNWELSAARAATVVRELIALTDLDRSQFRVVSYGSAQPVASNETAAGRAQNRRVRIAVLPEAGSYSRPFETTW